jgi:hypothetical protein
MFCDGRGKSKDTKSLEPFFCARARAWVSLAQTLTRRLQHGEYKFMWFKRLQRIEIVRLEWFRLLWVVRLELVRVERVQQLRFLWVERLERIQRIQRIQRVVRFLRLVRLQGLLWLLQPHYPLDRRCRLAQLVSLLV